MQQKSKPSSKKCKLWKKRICIDTILGKILNQHTNKLGSEKDQLLTKVASTESVTWQQEYQKGTGQSTQYMVT